VTYFPSIETRAVTLVTIDDQGRQREIATTSIGLNTRGEAARVSTQFAPGIPAESETIPGVGAFQPGKLLVQHQFHDGRGKCRLGVSGNVDGDGGLSWNIDSTTTDKSGTPGQDEARPVNVNIGEANGTYYTLMTDRLTVRRGGKSVTLNVDDLIANLLKP
jgi:hypothetical protein